MQSVILYSKGRFKINITEKKAAREGGLTAKEGKRKEQNVLLIIRISYVFEEMMKRM